LWRTGLVGILTSASSVGGLTLTGDMIGTQLSWGPVRARRPHFGGCSRQEPRFKIALSAMAWRTLTLPP